MRPYFNFLAGLCHVLTILGGIYAAIVLFGSLYNIAYRDIPDFSSVIALSFAIIPYLLGRAFQSLAELAKQYEPADREVAQCPACMGLVPYSASICRHCHSELIPLSEAE